MLEEQEKRKKKKKQKKSHPREDPSLRLSTFIAHQSGLERGVIGWAELVDCVPSGDFHCGELGPSPVDFVDGESGFGHWYLAVSLREKSVLIVDFEMVNSIDIEYKGRYLSSYSLSYGIQDFSESNLGYFSTVNSLTGPDCAVPGRARYHLDCFGPLPDASR